MIITLIIVWGCALVFTGIGICAYRMKDPMWFWSGSTVKREELTDTAAYNRANGRMWIGYSLLYWLAGAVGMWNGAAGGIALGIAAVGGSMALIPAYNRIYKKYARK